jgi:hypothetical protein
VSQNPFTGLPLWSEFEKAALQHRSNPVQLLSDYMKECLATWEDQASDEQISHEALTSGYGEEEAVEIVRRYRNEPRAGS